MKNPILVIAAIVLLLASDSFADVRYTITELPPPPGATDVEANSINDLGQVVGVAHYAQGMLRPVLWKDGVPTVIPGVPPAQSGYAQSINNRENVGLNWWDDFRSYRAAISGGGREVALRPLGSSSDLGVLALNDNDHAVGYSLDGSGRTHAVLWRSRAVVSLGITGEMGTMARDIDDSDRIVGVRVAGQVGQAFRWHHGQLSWLQPLHEGSHAAAVALNNLGQAVGHSTTEDGRSRAVTWAGVRPVELGTLPQHASSVAADINDAGTIVGTSYTSEASAGVLWQGGATQDLNGLIPAQSGWYLYRASAINGVGQVAGRGLIGNREAVYLLTPVPEPAGGLGVAMLMMLTLRQRTRR